MNDKEEWGADDATWKLLGEAGPTRASGRFADDTVRAVKLLPEAGSWWPKIVSFSPWAGVAAYGVLVAFLLLNGADEGTGEDSPVVIVSAEEKWVAIAEVAEVEMLAAAADDLDSFSDQELVSLIGF